MSLNVSLTPELEDFVEKKVIGGRYRSASEVIREGLRLLEEQEKLKLLRLDELQRALLVGIDQLDHGKVVTQEELDHQIAVHRRIRRADLHA